MGETLVTVALCFAAAIGLDVFLIDCPSVQLEYLVRIPVELPYFMFVPAAFSLANRDGFSKSPSAGVLRLAKALLLSPFFVALTVLSLFEIHVRMAGRWKAPIRRPDIAAAVVAQSV